VTWNATYKNKNKEEKKERLPSKPETYQLSLQKRYNNAMVAYKQDNAMVTKYPPQVPMAAKHLPEIPPTAKHPLGKKRRHPLRQSIRRERP
jgi:hypothetical protein